MTNEEAIEHLDEFLHELTKVPLTNALNRIKVIGIAKVALDFRTPKAPAKDITGETVCPHCRSLQRPRTDTISYCVWCGQAIKWR